MTLNKFQLWILRIFCCVGATVSILVSPLRAQYVYVLNENNNTLSGFAMNPTTGVLTPVPGSPSATGSEPLSITVDPVGRFLYIPNLFDNTISVFAINPVNGGVAPIPGSPFPAISAGSATVDPTGRFAYVVDTRDDVILAYKIDAVSGALTAVPGTPVATGELPKSVTVDPSGRFVYVSNWSQNDNSISGYRIDTATGSLTPIPGSPFPGGSSPIFLKVDVNDKYAYGLDANSTREYAVDPVTGALTLVASWVFPVIAIFPPELDIDPTGKFLFVALQAEDVSNILGYEIDPLTGSLSPVAGSPFSDLNKLPSWLAFDPSGKFAYVANGEFESGNGTGFDNTVSAYAVNPSSGFLTTVPGSPFISGTAGSGPYAIAITPLPSDCGTVSPGSLSFPSQATETSSIAETLVFTNGGATPLTMNNISAVGPFAQTNNCGTSLAAGAHCMIEVIFDPVSAGAQTGVLTIVDSGPMSPHIVNLSGSAIAAASDFTISVAPGSPTSQTVLAGGMATYSVALAESAGSIPSVSLACTGQPQDSTCSISPNVMGLSAASQNAKVTITTVGTATAARNNSSRDSAPTPWVVWLTIAAAIALALRSPRLESVSLGRRTAFALAAILFALIGCATMNNESSAVDKRTPAGTYTVIITATAGSVVHTTSVQLIVH